MLNIKHIEWISPEPLNSAQTEAMTEVFAQGLHSEWRAERQTQRLSIDSLAIDVAQGAATQRGLLKQAAQRTVAQIIAARSEAKR
ncbi:MAG TPA: hypothetical protein VJM53_04890 [Burkholderiales bacterium]|jgi:hypothetical protein|nr:hypothetical protein [Burkholderiales bacterium]